jgi:hypothetical protein
MRVMREALEYLDLGDTPQSLDSQAGSWAGLAVYLMHEHRPTHARTAEVLDYEKAAAAVSHLFPAADAALVDDLAVPFTNRNGSPVDPDAVMDLLDVVVQDNPLDEAIDILAVNHPAWRVDKHGNQLLHVDAERLASFLQAAETLDAVPGTETVGAWVTGTTAAWAIAIRYQGTLIRVEKNARGQITWQHYQLNSLTNPIGIARNSDMASRARINTGPHSLPFAEAMQALAAVGMDLSADPPSSCPAT